MKTSNSSTSISFWNQHKWKIAWMTALVLAAGSFTLIFALHTPHFQASVLIDIEATAPFVAFSEDKLRDRSVHYIETQLELIRSPIVLAPVITRPEIATLDELRKHQALTMDGHLDPIAYLRKHLSIRQIGKSELYQICYSSPSAHAAAEVANAVSAVYLELQADEEYRRSQQMIDLLEKECSRHTLEVQRLRQRVLGLAKELTGKDPFTGIVVDHSNSTVLLRTLYQSLTEVEVERAVLQAEIKSLQETISNQHPNSQTDEKASTIEPMVHKLTQLDVKIKLLSNRLKEHLNDRPSKNDKSVQLEYARAELAREEKLFELIAARKLALQTELHAPARVRLRQPASIPCKTINPIPYKKLLIGCLIAFVIPLAITLAYHPAKNKMK